MLIGTSSGEGGDKGGREIDVISMRYTVERGAGSKRAYHDCCREGGLNNVRTLSSWEYSVLAREVPCA